MDKVTNVLGVYDGELRTRSTQAPAPCTLRELITFLTRLGPYTLPLLRRLQLSPISEESIIVTVGMPLDKLDNDGIELAEQTRRVAQDPLNIQPKDVWTIALIHRAGHPSTELWFFSSLELAHGKGDAAHEKGTQPAEMVPHKLQLHINDETRQYATLQIAKILSHVPITFRQPEVELSQQVKTYGSPGSLAGNVHTTVASLLASAGLIVFGSQPYGHYVYPAVVDDEDQRLDGSSEGLPEGLILSTIQPSDHADVMAVNKIVRSAHTIAHLPSVAVRHATPKEDGNPGKAVAFGFASGDGSLRTLHVDSDFRRKGLAKAVIRRLLNSGVFAPPKEGPFSPTDAVYSEFEKPHPLAFSSVEKSNVASIKTFEGIGAKWQWDVYWVWVDLDKARGMLI